MRTGQNGFSLIELVMFIIIVGIAVVAMAQIYTTNVAHSHEPLMREKALKIANFYMDEIAGKRWDENTSAEGGCIETGSSYCTTYCGTFTPPDCGLCTQSGGICVPQATIGSMGSNEETKRSDFDDVDDYTSGSLSSTPSFPNPSGVNGETALTDVSGYSVNVTITQAALGTIDARDGRRIVVTVTSPTGEALTLTRYRLNF